MRSQFNLLLSVALLTACDGVTIEEKPYDEPSVNDTADGDGSGPPDTSDTSDTSDTNGNNSGTPYGPDNDWYHADESEVPSESGCGFRQGDKACNFTMIDQNGDRVELYQFAGKYIVLDLFAEW